MLLIILTL